jgi:orotidine-5'-phosphate decarboxylase
VSQRRIGVSRAGDFGAEFVALARPVYRTNDHRAAIQRRINQRLGSEIVEETSYAAAEAGGRLAT